MHKKLTRIGKHLGYILVLTIVILYIFFYVALPHITRQGKQVQVPDLTGISIDRLDDHLKSYLLRYVIIEQNSYSEQLPPFTVIQQLPTAGSWVKEDRKIYLVLNASHPPKVAMPNLIEGSLKQAKLLLENVGLQMNHIIYKPDIAKYTVLEQWHNGHPITVGKLIPKKSKIDVVVGAGLGKQIIKVPDLSGCSLEDVQLLLLESGIGLGKLYYEPDNSVALGHIFRQNPQAGTQVKIGSCINLWIADPS